MKNDAESLLAKASALQRLSRNAEAIVAYQRLLAVEPDLPDSWYNLGLLLRVEARFDEALAAYDQALAKGAAQQEEIHLNRSVILADDLRREDDAKAALKMAINHNPTFAPAWLNLGNLLEGEGAREEAAAAYEKIVPPPEGMPAPYQDCRFEALARLIHLRAPGGLGDPLLRRVAAAANGPAFMPLATRANLFYALGQALDTLGAYDEAFAAFEFGEQMRSQSRPPL